jgi:HD superfamily phosphodiesterase
MLARDEAAGLLARRGGGAAWTRHCEAVAAAAVRLGRALARRRGPGPEDLGLDRLWTLGLLHDIGRCVTHDPLLHGVEGYRLLTELGHPEEAHVCASHLLFGLRADEASHLGLPDRDFVPRTLAERIVPLVDFMMQHDRPVTLERRFASLRRRNTAHPYFLQRLDRAEAAATAFAAQLEADYGIAAEAVVAGS